MAETKSVTTKITPLDFDYLVIETGYVGRVVSHFLDHGYAFNVQLYKSKAEWRLKSELTGKEKYIGSEEQNGKVFIRELTHDGTETMLIQRPPLEEYEEQLEADPSLPKLAKTYRREYEGEPDYDEEEDEETGKVVKKPVPPLFISDTISGEGLYTRVGADAKEVQLVKKCVVDYYQSRNVHQTDKGNEITNTCGCIAFPCKEFRHALAIAHNLAKLNYCACFGAFDPCDVILLEDESGKRVLYLSYDCESG